ncbi:MAG TPA: hypothetical protein VM223_19545, partial [Planctomycetota bacterium]|nr:hypothetical protein [Planctomycetota bacterium]
MPVDKLPLAVLEIALLLIASFALADLPRPEDVLRQGVKRLSLTEHVRLNWPLQEVSFPLEFADGECRERSIILVAPDGKPMAFQLSAVTYHAGGQFVKSARIHFLSNLAAGESKTFGVYYGSRADDAGDRSNLAQPVLTDLAVKPVDAATLELSNGKIGLRVANGKAQYQPAQLSVDVPAP